MAPSSWNDCAYSYCAPIREQMTGWINYKGEGRERNMVAMESLLIRPNFFYFG